MDDDFDAGQDTPDPELGVIEQTEVPFLDELLLALLGADGDVYVPVVPFAERLGLSSPRSQIYRIKRDDTMAEALRSMPIQTAGGEQHTQCLRIDMLTLWLATIRDAAVKESVRPRLSSYKREAARAILAYFTHKAVSRTLAPTNRPMMPAPDAAPEEFIVFHEAMIAVYRQLATQRNALTAHSARLDQHESEIAALSDDMTAVKEALSVMGETEARISPHQAHQIQDLVSKIHEATGIHQAAIFAAFKKQWKIPRYDELPAAQFDAALDWLVQLGRKRLPQGG